MAGTRLLLVAALDARLLQQLAVLLLGHALAALLDDRAHGTTLLGLADDGHANTLARSGRLDTHPCKRLPLMWRASATDRGHGSGRPRTEPVTSHAGTWPAPPKARARGPVPGQLTRSRRRQPSGTD